MSEGESDWFAARLTKPAKSAQLCMAICAALGKTSATEDNNTRNEMPKERSVDHLRVLLAEDNPINQKVALRMLAKLGYRADAVADGLEVLQTLQQVRYDVILMDCQMPEMDGYEATRKIRMCEQEEAERRFILSR